MSVQTLKEGQVLILEKELRRMGIQYPPVLDDLLDHVCVLVAKKMEGGRSFMEAFETVKQDFGPNGLERVYYETVKNLNRTTMYKNYLISTWRNLKRRKIYTGINILGLVLGLSIFTTITIYTKDELNFDKFHSDNVYRISANIISNGQMYDEATCQFPLAETITNEISGITSSVRVHRPYTSPLLKNGDVKYTEKGLFYVDNSFFDVFGYQLIQGDPDLALQEPASVILTQNAALRYFGTEDVIGQILELETGSSQQPLTVTGIIADQNKSHFKFDMLVPMRLILNRWDARNNGNGAEKGWFWTGSWTYLKFQGQDRHEEVAKLLPAFVKRHFPDKWKEESKLELMAIEDIHLTSNKLAEIEPNGSLTQINIFSAIGLVILIIAIINFVNLMNAQGLSHIKQVGIRKSLGALKLDIVQQYLIESIILCTVSGLLAIGLVQFVFLEEVNVIAGKSLSIVNYLTWGYATSYIFVLVFIGFLAGLYPSIVLALLDALKILKGNLGSGKKGSGIRQAFVVIQFVASVVLIIAVILINSQNNFIKTMDTGFDRNNVLVLKATNSINERLDAFKTEIGKVPGVQGVSAVLDLPGRGTASLRFVPEGRPLDQPEQLPLTYADPDLIHIAGIKLVDGRFFDHDQPTDQSQGFVLNEKAAKLLGWENEAVGKSIQMYQGGASTIGKTGKVIGVIEDYNFESVYNPIRPLVMIMNPQNDYYLVKFKNTDLKSLTTKLQTVWADFEATWPMESFMLDRNLAQLYDQEEKLSKIINYGMIFALIIALIGIYGLSAYLLSRRTKEVGVRRVLGSTQTNLFIILSKNFMKLVLVANLIAWPIAYWLMSNWLNNFEYRVGLSWQTFLVSSMVSMLLAFMAIAYHAMKVSKTSPVRSLRYE